MENNVFEELAKRYDTEERKQLAAVIAKRVRLELSGSKEKSLLDYGGGTGLVSLELHDEVDKLTIADASEQMLLLAQAKLKERGIENADTIHADFTVHRPSLSADMILLSLVLLHIPDTKAIVQSLADILQDKGKLIIVDFDHNERVSHPAVHRGFHQGKLQEHLEEAGFTSVTFDTFYYGESIFMKQDASLFICVCKKRNGGNKSLHT